MFRNNKTWVIFLVSLFMLAGIAATKPTDDHLYKNLKVLPKDISKADLDKVMDGFKAALGVKCSYCHARSKDSTSHMPDFPSDDKPEKSVARKMMKMTAKINKKYFNTNKNEQGAFIPAVECMTCHRGSPHAEITKK